MDEHAVVATRHSLHAVAERLVAGSFTATLIDKLARVDLGERGGIRYDRACSTHPESDRWTRAASR